MPVAPRQGRKGGKIFTSPALASHEKSPASVFPSTLLPGGMASILPSDPNVLEFDLEALMVKKSANQTKNLQPIAAEATPAAATPSGGETNVLNFDLDAIQQIGQGVVVGGNKQLRVDTRKPLASPAEAKEKVSLVLAGQEAATDMSEAPHGLLELSEHEVVIVRQPTAALSLAVALNASALSKVLVVVPRYFEVATLADSLRQLKVQGRTPDLVGELRGQTCQGSQTTRLWVTCAQTALVYLHAQKSLAPFTHIVVPNLTRMTPLVSYFLWGLRERVFRQSANLDKSAPPLHLIISVSEGNLSNMETFFTHQNSVSVVPPTQPTVHFSYDEVAALAGMDVLEMEVDGTGKFTGPHWRLVEHSIKLACGAVDAILMAATTPQCIYVLTADIRETVDALQTRRIPNCVVFSGRFRASDNDAEDLAGKHRVLVMSSILYFADEKNDAVHFVLDMGTMRHIAQPSKSESFMAGSSTEWASTREILERQEVLGYWCAGGYLSLYPPSAASVFQEEDRVQPAICDVEDAILQCSRAEMPVGLATDVLVPCDPGIVEQVMSNLSEKCLLANPQTASITFLGEVAARLPLGLDFAHFVISGCAIGLGEASVLISAVATLSYRHPTGSGEELNRWKSNVLETRKKYAEDLARHSDLLADAIVYLEWLSLKVAGLPTEALLAELQVKAPRMEQIHVLLEYLRTQLSDYAFIDDMSDPRTIAQMRKSIHVHANIFIFLQSVSLARHVAFVRDAGALKVKDRAAALVFVRTAKKVVSHKSYPSIVPWTVGGALVPVDLRNSNSSITCSEVSVVSTSYLFASLLMLYPQVEYSAPVEVSAKVRIVYFGVTCNGQMKRFRTSIEEAAEILDFRERWNASLGYLQSLRTLRRPISRHRFELQLKTQDRLFDLSRFHQELQRNLVDLITEVEVSEHQGSFDTFAVHCLTAKEMLPPVPESQASDVVATQRFQDSTIWTIAPRMETPATVEPSTSSFPTTANNLSTFYDEDDEIELIAESYFRKHGPIIDDD